MRIYSLFLFRKSSLACGAGLFLSLLQLIFDKRITFSKSFAIFALQIGAEDHAAPLEFALKKWKTRRAEEAERAQVQVIPKVTAG